jgi:hypothetical protein
MTVKQLEKQLERALAEIAVLQTSMEYTPVKVYKVRCVWGSTSLTIKVKARDQSEALDKARKNRACKGASECVVVGVE